MADTKTINLADRIPTMGAIQFLQAKVLMDASELPPAPLTPFALIAYTDDEGKPGRDLRLDLDRQAFIDHFPNDQAKENATQDAAPRIVDIVSDELYHSYHVPDITVSEIQEVSMTDESYRAAKTGSFRR